MKKYLVILLILAGGLFSACSSSRQEVDSLPSWYISPTQNDSQNLYGVGEGFTLEEASNSALKNLAAKLMVTISAESSTLLEENNNYSNQEFRQKISETIQKIDFTDYKVTNSTSKLGKIYVEIAVNRDDFIKDQKAKLEEKDQKMSELYNSSQDKTILEKRNILFDNLKTAKEAEIISRILAGLNVAGINLNQNLKQYNIYQNAYNKVLDQIEFFIESDNINSRKAGNIIKKNLNNQKIKIARSKDSQNNNLVIVEIKSDAVSNLIYGSHIAKLKIDFSLISNKNQTISSNHIELTGSSRISNTEAIEAALSELSNQIDKKGIFAILGIKS